MTLPSPAREGKMHLILFLLFAGFCLAGAINLLLQSHPINSALSLIVVMTSLAVLYLLLGAEFLAAAQVIVYAGAIMVLFTFVVMLLNAGREERTLGSRAARGRLSCGGRHSGRARHRHSHARKAWAWRHSSDGITIHRRPEHACSSPNCCCPLKSLRC